MHSVPVSSRSFDTIVVGGGVVGLSLAYGLQRCGERVLVLDEGDQAIRAARGNFGLVWVQGKGLDNPAYARWTMDAAARWPAFDDGLRELTGAGADLSQVGGLGFFFSEDEAQQRLSALKGLGDKLGIPYPAVVLDRQQIKALIPLIGPDVAAAVFCHSDGHVSPLKLLRALFQGYAALGGAISSGVTVSSIKALSAGGFAIDGLGQHWRAGKVVLAAGLGNKRLAPYVGLHAPVEPNRGQILVTERTVPFLRYPTIHVRQTTEGVVQIGDSKENVGFDRGTTAAELARISSRAIRYFPHLKDANVMRTWGALRVMSADGLPIYDASRDCPGAFVVSCHSGITLAPQHAGPVAAWIHGGGIAPADQAFSAERFDVQVH
jgi:glycine/D-amino acid oxidase-like deaminating enzyme